MSVPEKIEALVLASLMSGQQARKETVERIQDGLLEEIDRLFRTHRDALMKTLFGLKYEWGKWEVYEEHPTFDALHKRAMAVLEKVFPDDRLEQMLAAEMAKPKNQKLLEKAISEALGDIIERRVQAAVRARGEKALNEALDQLLEPGVEKCLPTPRATR